MAKTQGLMTPEEEFIAFQQYATRVDKAITAIFDLNPKPSTKGFLQCPNCSGRLYWVKTHNCRLWAMCETPYCVSVDVGVGLTRH